ncbi:SpoIIIAH-like family protein [Amphibacillus xylanus]|uniref:Stage III sporulation protein AH n=1 Tax=Amphibacillus xylanus (strain ATCC 51415 / DSM 6626 / JCM 7361 / LMG 17667 / NBRC 15112 / Ep01) TaxID=698758 RepID=K0J2B6_AMPXN|nr:SpoIIIAH-like family protein [Amphibacillus xylanus]BAM47302.1 stage III sporulation protein AH [Amphibacillus xylanus NBRC 15112]
MLKKQTVWLLTLLSLTIVLSVFYMNSPDSDDFSFVFQEKSKEDTEKTAGDLSDLNQNLTSTSDLEGTDLEDMVSSVSTEDDLFTLIRMELAQSRSSQMEKLESVVASGTASADEKNTAFEELTRINQLSTKELIVEESLKAEYGYPDVLVRSMEDTVIVTVKTDQLSDKEANEIMRTVYDEFGALQVEVKFQPSNS